MVYDQLIDLQLPTTDAALKLASDAPGSDGVTGLHERMEKLGGRCVINSQAGQGTTVEFSLALGKNGL